MHENRLPSLKIRNLEISPPIIQGGMAVRVSGANLASSVANTGGVGVIASAGLGFLGDIRGSDAKKLGQEVLRQEIKKARRLTDGPIGVNIMVACADYENHVKSAVDEAADMIISGAGLPLALPGYVGDADIALIPVIAAGGIFTGRDIAHFLRLGAAGVQMATRFVCTDECDAHDNFKRAYLKAEARDITIIKSPVGLPGRVINNGFVESVKQGKTVPFNCEYQCLRSCDPRTAPYCIAKVLANAAQGRLEASFAFAGANAHRCREIVPVAVLVESLTMELAGALAREKRFFGRNAGEQIAANL